MKQNEEIYIAEFDVEQPHTILVFKVLWLLMLLCYVEFSMNLLVLLVILFSGAQQFPINVTLLIEFVWISWSCLILAYFYCLIFILVADETKRMWAPKFAVCYAFVLQTVEHGAILKVSLCFFIANVSCIFLYDSWSKARDSTCWHYVEQYASKQHYKLEQSRRTICQRIAKKKDSGSKLAKVVNPLCKVLVDTIS